jgi:hypothetical protein
VTAPEGFVIFGILEGLDHGFGSQSMANGIFGTTLQGADNEIYQTKKLPHKEKSAANSRGALPSR